jgi:hypothetical protein
MEAETRRACCHQSRKGGSHRHLRGNSAPYAFRMNIRQSRISLADIDVCSCMISWKRGTRCICCATTRASSTILLHAEENCAAEGKLVGTSRTDDPSMRVSWIRRTISPTLS